MTVVSVLLAVLLIGEPNLPSEEADELRTAIDRWISLLEAPTLAERFRAERELLDLGPKILPWLPPNDLLPGANSRDAVKRLRSQLEKRLAQNSARPSRVTLSGEFGLSDLVSEITRQTSNPIRLAEGLPASLLAERGWSFEDVSFWNVIDAVSETLNLAVDFDPESDALLLAMRVTGRPHAVSRVGVLRAELTEVSRHPVTGDATRSLTRLQGELALEPRLRPLFVHFKAGDFSAVDASDRPIDNWNPKARYELPMAGASRRTKVTWDFVSPADGAPQQLSLRGKVLVHLAAATEQIRFDRLQTRKDVLRRRGGVSVRLHHVEFTGQSDQSRAAKLRVTVSYDTGGPAFESHRTWVYHNAAWMESDRRRYPLTDFDTLQQTDGSVQLEYRFQNLPADDSLTFVYEAPTLLLDVPFELEFHDVLVDVKK